MRSPALSLENKIYLTLILCFVAVLGVTLYLSATDSRRQVLSVVEQQAEDAALSYFDSLNVLMLTGSMHSRDTLQSKMLSRPGVTEARVIRSEAINKVFGPGMAGESVADALDERALAGEDILEERQIDGEPHLTVLKPMRALADYHGTNCLQCHVEPEGTVLGAVRLTFNLSDIYKDLSGSLIHQGIMMSVVFAVGLAVLVFLIRNLVIRRIKRLQQAMQSIEKDSDLTRRIRILHQDEIGATTQAFNHMLDQFQRSMQAVSSTMKEVSNSSEQIARHADSTATAVNEQQSGTDMMASAILEMEATSQDFRSHAQETAEASEEADVAAREGGKTNQAVIKAITGLSGEIAEASKVIASLDERIQAVGSVLGVIKGIAEQTNLLALNAAIEAARAGETGRGFAVVADEVRALANRTAESAEEIERMIAQLKQEAEDAVDVMGRANRAAETSVGKVNDASELLQTITERVAKINTLNASMRSIAGDQRTAAAEISETVQRIAEIANLSADDASATASLSADLLALEKKLVTLISQFKID